MENTGRLLRPRGSNAVECWASARFQNEQGGNSFWIGEEKIRWFESFAFPAGLTLRNEELSCTRRHFMAIQSCPPALIAASRWIMNEISLHPNVEIDRPIPVVLADDHPLVREGLACLLARDGAFAVVGQAGTCVETLVLIEKLSPKVVALDLFMHGFGGVGLVEELSCCFPGVSLLVLAEHEESIYAAPCLRAGAAGYVMKNRPVEEILTALRRVASGDSYTSPELRLILLETMRARGDGTSPPGVDSLSARELDVFHLLGQRLNTPEIATRLSLSGKTIESYYDRLKQKLACTSMRALHVQAEDFARVLPS
ncbi:response regulator [bacterium]|nr:response regulator [bacterium]